MAELKPCPFCGKEPVRSHPQPSEFIIQCGNPECRVRVYAVDNFDLPVESWNTRAEEPERVAHWNINCDGYYPYCSRCKSEPPGREMSKYCPSCGAKMITRRREDT